MSKPVFFLFALILLGMMSFTFYRGASSGNSDDVEIPGHVQKIIDSKCFDCHSQSSKSLKAKTKLKFDELSELSKAKLVGKLVDIADEVEEGEMPPKSFLKKNPDKALSDEESKALVEWAKKASDELMK